MDSKVPPTGSFDAVAGQSFLNKFYQEYFNDLSLAVKSTLDQTLLKWFEIKPLKFNKDINATSLSRYNYSFAFGFEHNFESYDYVEQKKNWMRQNWTSSITISIIYMLLIVIGRRVMKDRQKFDLRKPLILWNIILAVFSIFGAVRTLPEFFHSIFNRGINYSICSNDGGYGVNGFWVYMFIMSKLPELVDTLFIVLRKQELIFLHYYHHATVLIYCWYSYNHFASSGRWFMNMNYVVHSIMYSYYALKAMRINVPRQIALLITTGQISQMVAGIFVNYIAWDTKRSGKSCEIPDENIKYSFLMYLSYFALFANFFAYSYIFGKNKKPVTKNGSNGHHASNGKTALNGDAKISKTPIQNRTSNGTGLEREP